MSIRPARPLEPGESPGERFALALEATPDLLRRLVLQVSAEQAKVEGERVRQQGMRILAQYLPPALVGRHGVDTYVQMPPEEVIGAYLSAAARAEAELLAIGLQVRIGGRALRRYRV